MSENQTIIKDQEEMIFCRKGCNFMTADLSALVLHEESCGTLPVEAKRDEIFERYDLIISEFEISMAKILGWGANHYGDTNYQKSRLNGGRSPINHIREHLNQYLTNKSYDHEYIGTERKYHLAAIAVNAMFEFWYECHPEVK